MNNSPTNTKLTREKLGLIQAWWLDCKPTEQSSIMKSAMDYLIAHAEATIDQPIKTSAIQPPLIQCNMETGEVSYVNAEPTRADIAMHCMAMNLRGGGGHYANHAKIAVDAADALIAELAKSHERI